ncbi:MAG: hypothetical protein FJX66_05520 [Alphaproteobacteria bacterium]|nr:hypothetical protein [Alphaproteobacteria bacterium]
MKNPLESLHKTIGMGVVLTAIMVLIIAIFYWESGSVTPAAIEKSATDAADAAKDAGATATDAAAGAATDAAKDADGAAGDAAGAATGTDN